MFCSRCGTWAPDTQTACASCGAPLAAAASTPTSAPVAASGPQPSAFVAPSVPAGPRRWPRDVFGGFWRRLAASLIDGLVLFFPQAIVKVLLGLPVFGTAEGDEAEKDLLVGAVFFAVYWIYAALLESSSRQATLGQQLFGLRVMDLDGRRIDFGRATGRYFAQVLSALLCGVGYLFNLWTSRRQTLHDLITGCVLVRPDQLPQEAPAMAGERV